MGLGMGQGRGKRDEARGDSSCIILRQLGKQWGASRKQRDPVCLLRGSLQTICGEGIRGKGYTERTSSPTHQPLSAGRHVGTRSGGAAGGEMMGLRGIALRVKPQGSRGYPRKGTGEPSPGSWVEGAPLPMGRCALLAQQRLGLEGERVSAHTWGGCGSFSPQEARVNCFLKRPHDTHTHTLTHSQNKSVRRAAPGWER